MHWIDPSVLPTLEGSIACFIRNTKGDVDGVLPSDDRQIHVPPHMGAGVEKLFALGDAIEACYVKPRDGDVFADARVTSASGESVVDDGPPLHALRRKGTTVVEVGEIGFSKDFN